jgi:hypothetical protein
MALYIDDDRTNQQVHADALRYSKFNFLIHWGESFDHIKAFLLKSGDGFRILYCSQPDTIGSVKVTRHDLVGAFQDFLQWMTIEKRSVPTA